MTEQLVATIHTYRIPFAVLWLAALGYVAWVHGFLYALEGCRPACDRDDRAWPSERGLR